MCIYKSWKGDRLLGCGMMEWGGVILHELQWIVASHGVGDSHNIVEVVDWLFCQWILLMKLFSVQYYTLMLALELIMWQDVYYTRFCIP